MTKKREYIDITSYRLLHPEDKNSVRIPVNTRITFGEGMRRIDLDNLDNVSIDILMDIYIYGRRRRRHFKKNDTFDTVKLLKSKGFIVSIKLGRGYSYDLSETAMLLAKHHQLF